LPIVHLLPPAGVVQLIHDLDPQGILKIRHAGIIEGQVAVLPNAQEGQVDGMLLEQPRVALALRLRVRRGAVQVVPVERQPVELVRSQRPKDCGAPPQAEVFVQVEGVDVDQSTPGSPPRASRVSCCEGAAANSRFRDAFSSCIARILAAAARPAAFPRAARSG
jgi:hypothetical protein